MAIVPKLRVAVYIKWCVWVNSLQIATLLAKFSGVFEPVVRVFTRSYLKAALYLAGA